MTDIVERLDDPSNVEGRSLRLEAKAEIERLREENKGLKEVGDIFAGWLEARDAEIEQLRKEVAEGDQENVDLRVTITRLRGKLNE